MLTIRPEQMKILGAQRREAFVERLRERCVAQWPDQTSQLGERCRPFVEAGIERAISYGMRTESSIARFVNLCFVWGECFESRPEHSWAARVLRDERMDGSRKVEELARKTRHKLLVLELNRRADG